MHNRLHEGMQSLLGAVTSISILAVRFTTRAPRGVILAGVIQLKPERPRFRGPRSVEMAQAGEGLIFGYFRTWRNHSHSALYKTRVLMGLAASRSSIMSESQSYPGACSFKGGAGAKSRIFRCHEMEQLHRPRISPHSKPVPTANGESVAPRLRTILTPGSLFFSGMDGRRVLQAIAPSKSFPVTQG